MISSFFTSLSAYQLYGLIALALIVVFVIHPRLYLCVWVGAVVYLIWDKGGVQAAQDFISEYWIMRDAGVKFPPPAARLRRVLWALGWVLFLLAMFNVRVRFRLRDLFRDIRE